MSARPTADGERSPSQARSAGALFLIPVPLGGDDAAAVLPSAVQLVARQMDCYVAESAKAARRVLKLLGVTRPLRQIPIEELNEHTAQHRLPSLIQPALTGSRVGLLSEAGCPAVADPGATLVRLAHQHGVRVVPLVGPSSLMLALMASGLNGQRFHFHGYLPANQAARVQALREMESDPRLTGAAQIFIETPYRNRQLFGSIIATCRDSTQLCIATDLTLATESIETKPVVEWHRITPDLEHRPTVFILQAGEAG